jgi:hypothetical protein
MRQWPLGFLRVGHTPALPVAPCRALAAPSPFRNRCVTAKAAGTRTPMQLFLSLLLATANAFEVPPLFTVNLDLAPRLRWNGALAAVLRTHSFEDGFLPIFEEHNRTLFDNVPTSAWPRLARSLEDHWPDHAEELKGIADEFSAAGHRVSFEYLAGWTWFHELAHSDVAAKSMETRECTALLARDSSGATLHGNMDQSPTAVRNVTLRVRFVRGGKRVFDGVDWYWFTTGVSRAVRAGVASAQENWRAPARHPSIGRCCCGRCSVPAHSRARRAPAIDRRAACTGVPALCRRRSRICSTIWQRDRHAQRRKCLSSDKRCSPNRRRRFRRWSRP